MRAVSMVSRVAMACVMVVLLEACRSPATAVLVMVDTNAPAGRAMRVDVVATKPESTMLPITRRLERGVNGLEFPLSFGVTPSSADRMGTVDLRFDVELPGRTALEPTLRWRRRVRFSFTPRQSGIVRVFLPLRCGEPAMGCPVDDPEPCTVARLCELANLTCGNRGECVGVDVVPDPLEGDASSTGMDGATDASMDASMDHGGPASDGSGDESDVSVVSPPDVACMPNCTGRVCGPDGCGGTCSPGCPPLSGAMPPTCTLAGQCDYVCLPGFANCGGGPDCETELGTQMNCGRCGDACSGATPICNRAMMQCVPGSSCVAPNTLCSGACVDTRSDTSHCGGCGNVCSLPNAIANCVDGRCGIRSCESGYEDCDRSAVTGCETDLSTDASHCGSCGGACRPGYRCIGGRCSDRCAAGLADCNGVSADGCEVNLVEDRDNCGVCGRACRAGERCEFARCTSCPSGFMECGGTCEIIPRFGGPCSPATGTRPECISPENHCVVRCVNGGLSWIRESLIGESCGGGLGVCDEVGYCRCLSDPMRCLCAGTCQRCGSTCS